MEAKRKAVYISIEDEKLGRPIFRRVGTAFVNRDTSLDIVLDALPMTGRLHVRDPEPQRAEGEAPEEVRGETRRGKGKEVTSCSA